MTIEIHQPELEALIELRMASGRFQSIEEVLMQALKASQDAEIPPTERPRKQSFTKFMMASPLAGSGLEFETWSIQTFSPNSPSPFQTLM